MNRFSKGNFVGLHRGGEADFLQRNHPAAFLLLCLISSRARYTEEPCLVTGLRFGESLIGDWKEAGLTSEKSYRCAKSRLEKGRLCAFRRASLSRACTRSARSSRRRPCRREAAARGLNPPVGIEMRDVCLVCSSGGVFTRKCKRITNAVRPSAHWPRRVPPSWPPTPAWRSPA